LSRSSRRNLSSAGFWAEQTEAKNQAIAPAFKKLIVCLVIVTLLSPCPWEDVAFVSVPLLTTVDNLQTESTQLAASRQLAPFFSLNLYHILPLAVETIEYTHSGGSLCEM
jgi:hypothetical protein